MTRFPDRDSGALPDPLGNVIDTARQVLDMHGLRLHLASDRQIEDDLWVTSRLTRGHLVSRL